MDYKSVQLYLDILKEGTERKRDIRIIIVGKKGSGKTSLTRRLLKESLDGIQSTNGIDIRVKRCCIRTKDGKWLPKEEKETGNVYKSRILEQIVQSGDKGKEDRDTDNPTAQKVQKFEAIDISQEKSKEHQANGANKTTSIEERSTSAALLYERKENDHLSDLKQVLQAPLNDEEFANLFLWDFAGDEEFYNTHQIFLAKDVIYVVVTKLGDQCDDMPGAFKFWFDSVHCYVGSTPGEDRYLLPPIIVVGTHSDEFQGNDALCNQYMRDKIDSISGSLKRHIRFSLLLSNIKDPEEKIDSLREKLFETATLGQNWNIELPLKFVLLEEALQDRRELEIPILSLEHIESIAKGTKQPTTNKDELDLFLRYQHEIGSLIYFADIPDYIILDTQWLANAFRCIISADKFLVYQLDLPALEWNEVRSTGRLSKEILDAIFSKQPKVIQEKKDFILILMEKFDLLARPRTTDGKQTEDYYVPCMVKNAFDDIGERYFPDIKEKTHCLCLLFDFLPPPVFIQLVIVCCRRQDFYSSKIIINDKEYPAFFKDVAVFDICQNECEKLIIAKKENVIQLQVWRFGRVKQRSYEDIREFITTEIERLLKERFRVSNVPYKEMMKCPETKYNTLVGMREYITDMTIEEYRCAEHQKIHAFKDDWFGKQKPGFPTIKILAHLKRNKLLKCKTSSANQIVYIDVVEIDDNTHLVDVLRTGRFPFPHCERHLLWVNLPLSPSYGVYISQLRAITKEQMNFMRIGMITLDILADALYDLLRREITVGLRENYDITRLYSEHRNLKKNTPTKGWGGKTIADIIHNNIGDDIERIRLIRNEVQHTKLYAMDDQKCNDLLDIIKDVLQRFDNYIKPTGKTYCDRVEEVKHATFTSHDYEKLKETCLQESHQYFADKIEIHHHYHNT